MKHLVILRHGAYLDACYSDEELPEMLSPKGKAQYEKLATDIQTVTLNGSVYVITSPAPRAVGGAEILSARLKLVAPIEKLLFLWDATDIPREWNGKPVTWDDAYYYCSNDGGIDRLEKILQERADKADVLVMLSHRDLASDFASHCSRKYLGNGRYSSFEYGEGIHLDLETKNGHMLPLAN